MRSARDAALVLLLTLPIAGCGLRIADPEFALLTQFFSASRLRDLTALQKVSTVVFEPARDGIVTSFEIEAVAATGSESRNVTIAAPVRLPNGTTANKRFSVSVQRGRITAISEWPAAASTPPR